jgi:BirA family transcriptional regulator, biotin operon repressor / biotin---[acetyl-CoA-carboxylase] ligase
MSTPHERHREEIGESTLPVWEVVRVAETGSTNDDLMTAAMAGTAPHGRVLVADHQTAGRGRLDRRWEAPPGANLLASVLFRHGWTFPHELTQRVALAAADAAESMTGERPAMKWPNDLLIGDRKLAGILAQAGGAVGRIDYVVVGIGLNLGWAPDGAARLDGVNRDEFVEHWLTALAARWAEPVTARYHDELATLGHRVRVERAGGNLEGVAHDVEPDGTLIVRDDAGTDHRVAIGDVIHLRRTSM